MWLMVLIMCGVIVINLFWLRLMLLVILLSVCVLLKLIKVRCRESFDFGCLKVRLGSVVIFVFFSRCEYREWLLEILCVVSWLWRFLKFGKV